MNAPAPDKMTLARQEIDAANSGVGRNPIKIGLITPLTPPGDATAGLLVSRGARLGIEYLREMGGLPGGRDVALVLENDLATAAADTALAGGDDKAAAAAMGFARSAVGGMAKLAIIDEVVAALGQWHLRTSPGVVDLCDRLGVPLMIENGDAAATHRHRCSFRTYFTIADRVPLMMDCLAAIGGKRIAVIAADTVFASTVAGAIVEYGSERHGMEFLRLDFELDTALDWRDQLRQIKAWGPDVFINGGLNVIAGDGPVGSSYRILEQAIEVGLLPGPAMMVTFGFPSRAQDYWQMAGDAGNGVMWPATRFRPTWEGLTDIGRWFAERFAARYGMAAPDPCLNAFTDVTIIGQAMRATGSADREAILRALESEEFHTWRGPVRFERGEQHWHHSPPEVVIMQYQKPGQPFEDAAIIYPPDAADADYAGPQQAG